MPLHAGLQYTITKHMHLAAGEPGGPQTQVAMRSNGQSSSSHINCTIPSEKVSNFQRGSAETYGRPWHLSKISILTSAPRIQSCESNGNQSQSHQELDRPDPRRSLSNHSHHCKSRLTAKHSFDQRCCPCRQSSRRLLCFCAKA